MGDVAKKKDTEEVVERVHEQAEEAAETHEIAHSVPHQTIQTHNQDNSVEGFISAAIQQQLPVETIERFLAMRKELKQDQAKEAFTIAMANFQKDCPVIAKTKIVKDKQGQERYRFAPIDSIILQVKHVLGANQLSYDFTEERNKEEGTVTVTCTITHSLGYTKSSSFTVEIGEESFMTDTQKYAARNTFAKRYAFCNVLGIATGDEDTDAKEIQSPETKKQAKLEAIQNMDVSEQITQINNCRDVDALKRVWIGFTPDQRLNTKLIEAKEEMKTILEQDAAGSESQEDTAVPPDDEPVTKPKTKK